MNETTTVSCSYRPLIIRTNVVRRKTRRRPRFVRILTIPNVSTSRQETATIPRAAGGESVIITIENLVNIHDSMIGC